MLIVVGNSPSSGSTFLGDLLDSTPLTICGSELALFSSQRMLEETYTGPDAMSSFAHWFRSPVSCLYLYHAYFSYEQLAHYGLSYAEFLALYRRYWMGGDRAGFVEELRVAFTSYRRLGERLILCEKTPQNIACAGRLLTAMEDMVFVHVVRNPAHVYNSLLRRGFSPNIAAATWLADVTAIMELESHPRVHLVHYEDLVAAPFAVVARLLTKVTGEPMDASTIECLYERNSYRQQTVKVASWSISQYGKPGNANRKNFSAHDRQVLGWMLERRINSDYRCSKQLADASMRQALQHYGYERAYTDICGGIAARPPAINSRGVMTAVRKWHFECAEGANTAPLCSYFWPLERALS